MREVLNYPQPDRKKLDIVKRLIDAIAENPDGGCGGELSELNRIVGKAYTALDFAEYWGWTDLDTLAERALTAEPPCVHDLSRDEMKEIVSVIKKAVILLDDNKAEYYMELLHRSLPLLNVQSYIRLEDDEESIVDHMLSAASGSVIAL